ncbi:CaiB/BaiF CoA transferase family protein [Enterovirga rhinocerotis]|uniref:Crotonobetainyl-CoA:carnitine CoA-transferase CaiB-like acyl-CoA transferase n=1 Tax=Enterovirga rhinocerotis TaxID=1339210 RepID=A0A4R7C8L6_9HYPH|nr:CoA transferase [Enterovirga rhinocerotis]TDR94994.1 crotonobetainyl-CoA:carnitine CoA-transferase CaiB-like acyl-CoA transferase [Enterovirga rhinocerotis]
MSPNRPKSSGPLDGIRILDLSTVILGPYATQVLADLGADVIKVEGPGGDLMRHVGPMRNPGMGHLFMTGNRNKRGIVLDLKRPEARDALLRIAKTVDVLVHNVRPQAMARLGLGYEDVAKVNPGIVYVAAVGFGAGGRYAGKPAYDDLIQGASGLASTMRVVSGSDPRYVPSNIVDRAVGLYCATAISSALVHRERTGEGQAVEVPMLEVFSQLLLGDHLGGLGFDPPTGPPHYGRLMTPHRRPYATKDGHICTLIYTDRHWEGFFRVIGREGTLRSDPRFWPHAVRAANIDAVNAFVAEEMLKRTSAEWRTALEEADIPVMPLNTVESLLDDPHLQDVGLFELMDHPTEGRVRVIRCPSTWSAHEPSIRRHAPALGEHNAEVFAEVGLSEDEIAALSPVPAAAG